MPRRVSMQTIADSLRLSKFAVSRALSGKPGVSEETRRSVLAAARALGYRLPKGAPEAEAAEPIGGAAYALIWMDPTMQNESSYWARLLTGVTTACRDLGWEHAVVSPRPDAPPTFPAYMDREACIGHIAVGTLSAETLASVQAMGGPLVLLDHEEPLVRADAVLNANADGAELLTNHLLFAGRRSFVFVGDDAFAPSFRERWRGCRQAIDAFGGGKGARLRKWTVPYAEPRWADGLHATLAALGAGELPDAFVCANDHIALETLRGLRRAGRRVPDDCAVAGFDNVEASAAGDPPLTTVELAKEALGRRAAEQLARRKEKPGEQPEKILLSARLVPRASG
ncbi:LacI family transcriptional regulator [Paenibacillus antri]|uniref:LacI family transcriptional regulator n=1 Tax=Paenibacillus antri TaxID=2582848 RepID=A0A5R9FYV8_9BACL|nr:LacI family DNA-binding transcriptional regulator [Paenibacillus antri]TLS49237.1 LacI family transcriptional regulator [Paenibacillus antri]